MLCRRREAAAVAPPVANPSLTNATLSFGFRSWTFCVLILDAALVYRELYIGGTTAALRAACKLYYRGTTAALRAA